MKSVEEQSHYDVLEIPVTARRDDIERAYPLVRAAYEPGALAAYSVFRTEEVAQICERIDLAYQVLTDDKARQRYDVLVGIDSGVPVAEQEAACETTAAAAPPALDEVEGEEEGDWDGPKLRRARLRRGIEIAAIADITKINPNYLRAIEEAAYVDLPAAVYTRGFVTAYARTIDIDPDPVVESFMANFEEARSERRRGRLLSGRR